MLRLATPCPMASQPDRPVMLEGRVSVPSRIRQSTCKPDLSNAMIRHYLQVGHVLRSRHFHYWTLRLFKLLVRILKLRDIHRLRQDGH
jgi:hypothetical protein